MKIIKCKEDLKIRHRNPDFEEEFKADLPKQVNDETAEYLLKNNAHLFQESTLKELEESQLNMKKSKKIKASKIKTSFEEVKEE